MKKLTLPKYFNIISRKVLWLSENKAFQALYNICLKTYASKGHLLNIKKNIMDWNSRQMARIAQENGEDIVSTYSQ